MSRDDDNCRSNYGSFGKSTVKAGITFGTCLAWLFPLLRGNLFFGLLSMEL